MLPHPFRMSSFNVINKTGYVSMLFWAHPAVEPIASKMGVYVGQQMGSINMWNDKSISTKGTS